MQNKLVALNCELLVFPQFFEDIKEFVRCHNPRYDGEVLDVACDEIRVGPRHRDLKEYNVFQIGGGLFDRNSHTVNPCLNYGAYRPDDGFLLKGKFRAAEYLVVFCENLVIVHRDDFLVEYMLKYLHGYSVGTFANKADTRTFVSMTT